MCVYTYIIKVCASQKMILFWRGFQVFCRPTYVRRKQARFITPNQVGTSSSHHHASPTDIERPERERNKKKISLSKDFLVVYHTIEFCVPHQRCLTHLERFPSVLPRGGGKMTAILRSEHMDKVMCHQRNRWNYHITQQIWGVWVAFFIDIEFPENESCNLILITLLVQTCYFSTTLCWKIRLPYNNQSSTKHKNKLILEWSCRARGS